MNSRLISLYPVIFSDPGLLAANNLAQVAHMLRHGEHAQFLELGIDITALLLANLARHGPMEKIDQNQFRLGHLARDVRRHRRRARNLLHTEDVLLGGWQAMHGVHASRPTVPSSLHLLLIQRLLAPFGPKYLLLIHYSNYSMSEVNFN